jgi:uncharacterized protein YbjQ (UPF0145 family)
MPGLLIESTTPGGQADKAGLRKHDVIFRYNDTYMMTVDNLLASASQGGQQNTLTVVRAGQVLEVTVPAGPLGVSVVTFPQPDMHIAGTSEKIAQLVRGEDSKTQHEIDQQQKTEREAWAEAVNNVQVTTAMSLEGYRVTKTLGIVSSENVAGINIIIDFFTEIRDSWGGRSRSMQSILRDARQTCILELKAEAQQMGANAVIAVDLDYSEISGGGKNMLMIVGTGTAVIVEGAPI